MSRPAALLLLTGLASSPLFASDGATAASIAAAIRDTGVTAAVCLQPHAELSHSLWLHSALVKHRKRGLEPERAALYVTCLWYPADSHERKPH